MGSMRIEQDGEGRIIMDIPLPMWEAVCSWVETRGLAIWMREKEGREGEMMFTPWVRTWEWKPEDKMRLVRVIRSMEELNRQVLYLPRLGEDG